MTARLAWRSSFGRRWLIVAISVVIGVATAAALALWLALRASLPQLDGSVLVGGAAMSQRATLQRDALGVVAIEASNRRDIAFATGFVHAQERFFQMDLMRRTAAGELAELVGARALGTDRANRPYGFRRLAGVALAGLPPEQATVLRSYVDGVNSGLQHLHARPFEYLLLRSAPREWLAEDSLLVIWSMYLELQGQMHARELARDWLRERSSAAELAALLPSSGPFDIAVDGTPIDEQAQASLGKQPSWLVGQSAAQSASQALGPMPLVGSNAWAVAGSLTGDHGALLENDMHLGLRLPNTWFRLCIDYPQDSATLRVAGLSLPGVPAIVAGSNGYIAWGFTNAYVESLKLVPLETAAGDPMRVKTPAGWEPVRVRHESLLVRGAASEEVAVLESSLGLLHQAGGRTYAVQWVAQSPGAVDFSLLDLEATRRAVAALEVAKRTGIPAQNFVVADRDGHIGWTIAGALAEPATETVPMVRLSPSRYPAVLDPVSGRIVSANNRQLARADEYRLLGDGGADMGARASHIARSLAALPRASEQDMLRIALDDRSFYLDRWKARLDRLLDDRAVAGQPRRAELKHLLQTSWTGRADPDGASYRIVRAFMYTLYDEVFGTVDKQLAQLDAHSSYALANPRWPLVLERLADEQPGGWWPAGQTWRDAELRSVDQAMKNIAGKSGPLAQATWGQRNVAAIRHPFADLVPGPFAARLSAPPDALAGDDNMPRVSAPEFGQSMRMVVSPGHEERAVLDMPGGQSGHPLSPFFLSTHREWQRGEPMPLLPGPPVHSLVLTVR
ncbi:penicillin acylase family protein [Rubrivivax gelatinosus]|uniref:penicillin acylase family protein n=1 Tax=Rubrivivax gelatinosus TaxID=28068 RepID=UPI000314A4DE|nr:penicillin acylase family protein [Rubrivivax gelatinosus]MBG6082445.1 penicillin amidase [Rubrivivax gelatinosus]